MQYKYLLTPPPQEKKKEKKRNTRWSGNHRLGDQPFSVSYAALHGRLGASSQGSLGKLSACMKMSLAPPVNPSGNHFPSIFSLLMLDSRCLEMAIASQFCVWGVLLLLRKLLSAGQHLTNARGLKITRTSSAYCVRCEMLRLMSKQNLFLCGKNIAKTAHRFVDIYFA